MDSPHKGLFRMPDFDGGRFKEVLDRFQEQLNKATPEQLQDMEANVIAKLRSARVMLDRIQAELQRRGRRPARFQ